MQPLETELLPDERVILAPSPDNVVHACFALLLEFVLPAGSVRDNCQEILLLLAKGMMT